jgi:hypothetical protein
MAMFGRENADMARVHTRKAAHKKLAASGAAKLSLSEIIVPPAVPSLKNTSKTAIRTPIVPQAVTTSTGGTMA